MCQVVETALVVDVATKYSCNCTKDCIFKVWTLNCKLLAWQFSTISVVDLDSRTQHKIKQLLWSYDAAHRCFHQPYRRRGMSYQVKEFVVTALAQVVGSGNTVDCGIMYVPNGWWKQVGYVLRPDGLLDFVLGSAV
jgi:hypothetical protein